MGMYPLHALCSMLDFETPAPTESMKKGKGSKSARTKAPKPTKSPKIKPSKGPNSSKGSKQSRKSKKGGGPVDDELFVNVEVIESEQLNRYSIVQVIGLLSFALISMLSVCCYLRMQRGEYKN